MAVLKAWGHLLERRLDNPHQSEGKIILSEHLAQVLAEEAGYAHLLPIVFALIAPSHMNAIRCENRKLKPQSFVKLWIFTDCQSVQYYLRRGNMKSIFLYHCWRTNWLRVCSSFCIRTSQQHSMSTNILQLFSHISIVRSSSGFKIPSSRFYSGRWSGRTHNQNVTYLGYLTALTRWFSESIRGVAPTISVPVRTTRPVCLRKAFKLHFRCHRFSSIHA